MANISKRKPQVRKIVENLNSNTPADQPVNTAAYAVRNPASIEQPAKRMTANRASRAKGTK